MLHVSIAFKRYRVHATPWDLQRVQARGPLTPAA